MAGRGESAGGLVGESKEASETLVPAAGEASSDVLGTYKQLLRPKAILAFLQLLPIFVERDGRERERERVLVVYAECMHVASIYTHVVVII